MTKIAFVVNSLGPGGAEGMLLRLLTCSTFSSRFEVVLIQLDERGSERASQLPTITHYCLSGSIFKKIIKLRHILAEEKIEVAVSWLYLSDLLTLICCKSRVRKIKTIWNIRHSDFVSPSLKVRIGIKFLAKLSRFADGIIFCAKSALSSHEEFGYKNDLVSIINNGYVDQGSTEKRLNNDEGPVFGCLARYHSQKNHHELCKAFDTFRSESGRGLLKLAGPNISNPELEKFCSNLTNAEFISLENEVDASDFFDGLDWHILVSTHGEGFPNVVAESMLRGIPNIVTDAGDSFDIVGEFGITCEKDQMSICDSLKRASSLGSSSHYKLGRRARKSVMARFEISKISERYGDFIEEVSNFNK